MATLRRSKEVKVHSLGLSRYSQNVLVFRIVDRLRPQDERERFFQAHGRAEQRQFAAYRKSITVGEAMSAWDTLLKDKPSDSKNELGIGHGGRAEMKAIFKWLVDRGFSRLDWAHLPVVAGKAESIPKHVLRKKLAIGLETVPGSLIGSLRCGKHITEITIDDMLSEPFDDDDLRWRLKGCRQYFFATQDRLRALGFTYEDGPFMRFQTRRGIVETVMKECRIGRIKANFIVDSNRKMGGGPHWRHDE